MAQAETFKKPGRRLAVLLFGVFLFCVVALVGFYIDTDKKADLRFEIAKAFLEIGVISLAGTAIDLLVSGYERRLAERSYLEDLLRSTLTRITASYNRSKGARRKMRARGLRGEPPDETVRLAGYDEIMDEVNDAQLELEAIIDEIKTSEKAYPSAKALLSDLDKMQDYLNAIVDEYEKAQRTPDAAAGNLRLDGLTEMSDFVAKASSEPTPRFKSVYGKAHKQVRTAIRNDLGKLAGIEPQAEPKK